MGLQSTEDVLLKAASADLHVAGAGARSGGESVLKRSQDLQGPDSEREANKKGSVATQAGNCCLIPRITASILVWRGAAK